MDLLPSDAMTLSESLKAATLGAHQAAERAPFFARALAGDLPKQSAVSYLRGLAVIHGALERALGRSAPPAFWRPADARLAAVISDLEANGAPGLPDIPAASDAALDAADRIMSLGDALGPLAGTLYVVEGSLLGGQALAAPLAAALGAPGRALAYYSPVGESLAARWRGFKGRLDALDVPEEGAIKAALATFGDVTRLAEACHPYEDRSLRRRVSALNPEAGRHAMPRDDRSVSLALAAAEEAWRRHPYLEARFGARGRRFTHSDSCWLASLREAGPAERLRGILWLAGILAPRGLPSIILERHLESLDRAFADDAFAEAARTLRERRSSAKPDPEALRTASAARGETAELLLAAAADEAAGFSGAWDALAGWLKTRPGARL